MCVDTTDCTREELEDIAEKYKKLLEDKCQESQRFAYEVQCLLNLVEGYGPSLVTKVDCVEAQGRPHYDHDDHDEHGRHCQQYLVSYHS